MITRRVPRLVVPSISRMLLGLGLLGLGCGGREPVSEESPAIPVMAEQAVFAPPTSQQEPAQPPVPADLGLGVTFAHQPHADVRCATCHTSVPGHVSHRGVDCADCHPAPSAAGPARTLTEEECLRCHHTTQVVRDCAGCHATGPVVVLEVPQQLTLTAAGTPVERELPFRHSRHQKLDCARCHASDPRQTLAAECSGCHEEHHGPTSPCGSCHFPSPLSLHEAPAHAGCSGSACHGEASDRIPDSRARCISCHREQERHEPGGGCSTCHFLNDNTRPPDRGGSSRGSAPRRLP